MPKFLNEHETFVNLILVACENNEIKQQLLKILQLPLEKRYSALTELTHNLKLNEAPQDFIEAICFLKNIEVAQQVLVLLSE